MALHRPATSAHLRPGRACPAHPHGKMLGQMFQRAVWRFVNHPASDSVKLAGLLTFFIGFAGWSVSSETRWAEAALPGMHDVRGESRRPRLRPQRSARKRLARACSTLRSPRACATRRSGPLRMSAPRLRP